MALKKTKPKKAAKKKATSKAGPKKVAAKKTPPRKRAALTRQKARAKSPVPPTLAFDPEEAAARSGGQAGSLQGLSDSPDADSESVDELLEEGNALEAGVVEGVEDAPDADAGPIKTHEVLEDDVPDEYLDNDQ